jgi:hypothetical protein
MRAVEAAKKCGVSMGALVRWIRKGKLLSNGQRRRLEGYPAGRSWMTTVEALARFLASDERQQHAPPADPARARRSAAERAEFERVMKSL